MKLLFYSHFFAPSIGGVETIVRSLTQGLAQLTDKNGSRAFDIRVVTQIPATDAADTPDTKEDKESSFRVIRRPSAMELLRLIRGSDAVHVAGPAILPMALSLLAGKPFVVEHHGYQSICPNGLLVHQPDSQICPGHFQARRYTECIRCEQAGEVHRGVILSLLLTVIRNWLVRRAKANIAVSCHVNARLALPHSKIIYHGIDIPDLSLTAPPSQKICFAYLGRFVPEKGIAVLLEAAATLRRQRQDFAVKLIGDGPEREKIHRLIASLNLKDAVAVTGLLSGSALHDALRDASVVVMPSTWEETAGLSAIEQMMRGRLVIASRAGGLAEIVEDAGMTFEMGSSDALSECMLRVLNQPSLIDSYGRKARIRAEKLFQRSRMIAEHAALYAQLLP